MATDASSEKSLCSCCGSIFSCLFPAVTQQSILAHYVPLFGAVSHGAFAVHILNPSCLTNLCSHYDLAVANALLFNSHIGTGMYVYHRRHMRKVSQRNRVMYGVYTSILFNFGSVLLWATTKTILPKNPVIKALFGVLTSFCFIAVGREYLSYVDTLAADDSE